MPSSYLKTIRLNLARTPGHPEGSDQHYYRFTAPLTDDGHLDPEAWKKNRDKCRVVRFWDGEEEVGHVLHRPGGSWAFVFDIEGDDESESGYRLGSHTFVLGEYVTIAEEDGEQTTFWVASVVDA
jgi:hypothetical protein